MLVLLDFGALQSADQICRGILNITCKPKSNFRKRNLGKGRTDDIGRIVAGHGLYNTPEGIMAGYLLNKITGELLIKC